MIRRVTKSLSLMVQATGAVASLTAVLALVRAQGDVSAVVLVPSDLLSALLIVILLAALRP